jgi:hypothetical protein
MNNGITPWFFSILLALFSATGALADEAVSKRILGRWELPDGKEPMVFSKNGKCEVHFSDVMIKATYTISADGKITVNAKTKDITLTLHFHFEGDRLTDGVVYFEGGKRYWSKVKQ